MNIFILIKYYADIFLRVDIVEEQVSSDNF